MATVIDSLVVALGLDSKDLDSKAPEAGKKLAELEKAAGKTESGVKGIGKASKDTASELSTLGAKMGSFLALIGGSVAISAFVKDTIEANRQLYFLSQNLAMTAQSLFSLGAAGQRIGIGNALQGLAAMFREIPGQLEAGQQPPVIKLLARAGINWLGSPNEMMTGLAKWFSTMPANVALGLGTSYGLSYDQMTFLLQGAKEVSSQLSITKGFAPTAKETAQAVELKKQMTDLGLRFAKIGYDLLSMVTPALEKLLSILQAIGAWAQGHEKIVAIVAGLVAALGAFAGIAAAVGAVAIAWTALTGAIAAAWPVLAVVGIVTALAGAILLLWDDYKVWEEGGKSLFNWGDFAEGIDTAAAAFNSLKDKIEGATDAYGKWMDAHPKTKAALSAVGNVVAGQGAYQAGQSLREKTDMFLANHPNLLIGAAKGSKMAAEDFLIDAIAIGEGFYAPGNNIPKKAHNPGDIEYGYFARAHGATGYEVAQGGKKIATFPDDKTGFAAMRALLGTKGYARLLPDQIMSRWQTGHILSGIAGAASVPSSVVSSSSMVNSSTDNSKTTHIGTVNIQGGGTQLPTTPSMARGMDWTTLLTQHNFGLQ